MSSADRNRKVTAAMGQKAYHQALSDATNELESRVFQMGSLRQIGQLFEGSTQMEEVVTRGLEIIMEVTPAERGSIMLYFPKSGELCLLAAGERGRGTVTYFGAAGRPEKAFEVGEGLAGSCIADNAPIVASDVNEEPRFAPRGGVAVGSLACMPISTDGQPFGVINLSHSLPGEIKPEELPLLSILSSYLGIALSNAQLMEQLKDHNRDLAEKVRERTYTLERANAELRAAKDEIRKHNQELQAKVAERTEELERAMNALTERSLMLEEANSVKDEFLNNINHELKTPLNAIIGYAGLLKKEAGKNLSEAQLDDLDLIESNGKHLQQIIENIFALKAIEGGDMSLERQATDLNDLLKQATASVAPRAKTKGLTVTFKPFDRLPPVQADPTLILRCVYNLLDNAIKFSDQGEITVSAVVRELEDYKPVAIVSVRDRGRGVKPEDAQRIFEKFHQAEPSMVKQEGGSGVGLAISKTLVELHGGKLKFQPNEGGGSIFSFELPLE